MRLHHLDWNRVFAVLPQWEALPAHLRRGWLELQPAAFYTVTDSDEVRTLIDGGWLAAVVGKRVVGERYEVPHPRRYAHRVFRAFSSVSLFENYGRGEQGLLVDYLSAHYSPREVAALGRRRARTDRHKLAAAIASEEWLQHFLRWESARGGDHGPEQRWRHTAPATVDVARQLVALVIRIGAPISVAEWVDRADGTSRSELAPGLAFACQEALLQVSLDADARPFVGVWRSPGSPVVAAGRPAPAPAFEAAEPLLCRPLLIDDMVTLLVESTAAPPRLKADQSALFARASEAIGAALTALPAWIDASSGPLASDMRLDHAVFAARRLGLAALEGQGGKDLCLVVTTRGRRWLSLGAKERLRRVLDMLRHAAGGDSPQSPDEMNPYLYVPDAYDPADLELGLNYLPYDPGVDYPWHHLDHRTAVTEAFRSVAGAAAVDLTDFVQRQCRERNPMTTVAVLLYGTPQKVEQPWQSALLTFFYRRLVALGAVKLGRLVGGNLGFQLTPVGRYLLGETDQLEFTAAEESGEVLVQPNFEIVFLAPSVDAQIRARSYAEPTPALEGPESVGTLFALGRESVQRAVMAGENADHIIASLRKLSKHALPNNVERQVAAWAAEVRWIDVRPALVVDCGDAETAARVLAVVGNGGRQLSASAVEVLNAKKLTPALRKKLVAGSIFVRESS